SLSSTTPARRERIALNLSPEPVTGTCEPSRLPGRPLTRPHRRLQSPDFRRREWPEFPGLHIQLQRSVAHPLDLLHVVPNLLEHAPDLAVPTFDQRHLVPRVGSFLQQADLCRRRLYRLFASMRLARSCRP